MIGAVGGALSHFVGWQLLLDRSEPIGGKIPGAGRMPVLLRVKNVAVGGMEIEQEERPGSTLIRQARKQVAHGSGLRE